MKFRGTHATILLALALAFGCSSQEARDSEADRAAIASMYSARLEQIQVGATLDQLLDAYVAVLAEDAVWMPPNSPPVVGKAAIRSWALDFYARYALDVDSLPMDALEVGRDLAARHFRSVGTYIPSDAGEPIPYDQKYVDVLRREPDGSWKIILHMWSSNSAGPSIWQ